MGAGPRIIWLEAGLIPLDHPVLAAARALDHDFALHWAGHASELDRAAVLVDQDGEWCGAAVLLTGAGSAHVRQWSLAVEGRGARVAAGLLDGLILEARRLGAGRIDALLFAASPSTVAAFATAGFVKVADTDDGRVLVRRGVLT